ncbi:MAG TPA: hypothetical protein VM260_24695, partial [Pirellula sp.]|nr:hypothetical protein [Pirellula sp.]
MIRILKDIAKTPVTASFGERQFRLYREGDTPAEPMPSSAGASPSRKKTIQVECYFSFVFTLISGLVLTGCNKPTVEKEISTSAANSLKIDNQTTNADSGTKARAILEKCIAKYKGLKSYEDVGVLRIDNLASDSTDQKHTSEPMRIAFEAPNKLAIQAIDLQATWSSNTWEAVVGKANFKPFGNQRLVRPLPDGIDLKWLIVDNLGASLNAPVTGSPIQLQLLFDEKPLAYLLVPDSQFTLLAPAIFDSVKCDRVQVILDESKWVFWIDQENALLCKYEVPSPGLQTELAIELFGAKANPSVDWSVWQIQKRADDLLVRRFIDAPLRDTPPLVGKVLKPFDLRGADGKVILDSAQRTKLITVLCWVTNNELGEKFVKHLIDIQRELEKRLLNKAEIVLVSQAKAEVMQESLKRWNCSLPLAIDTENLTRNPFLIQHQPAVVILDKLVRVQHFDEIGYLEWIPDIVEDLQRGVDIASRRLQTEIDNQARFNSRLHRAMVENSQIATLPPIESFPFTYHGSKEAWHLAFNDPIIAASGERFYPQVGLPDYSVGLFAAGAKRQRLMTVLDELGHVYSVDNSGVKN